MKDMTITATRLDKFLHFLNILLWIAIGVSLVGLAFIAAYFLFDLTPTLIADGYNEVDVGMLSLTIADGYAPSPSVVLLTAAVQLGIGLVALFLSRLLLLRFREILKPMKEGLPFHNSVGQNLKKAAVYVIVWGVVKNLGDGISLLLIASQYHLPTLLLSDKITQVSFIAPSDLGFLFVAAVLFLLSYIFRYGESLQQLSDETL